MISIPILQSQIAKNSAGIRNLEESIKFLYYMSTVRPSSWAQNRIKIKKRKKDIASMVKVQKAMKKLMADVLEQEALNRIADRSLEDFYALDMDDCLCDGRIYAANFINERN